MMKMERWFKMYEEQVEMDMKFLKWMKKNYPNILKEYEDLEAKEQ